VDVAALFTSQPFIAAYITALADLSRQREEHREQRAAEKTSRTE
jgi:hypothetical protein